MDARNDGIAFADGDSGELLCLDHPLPFAAGEEIWFEEPCRREEGLVMTAHVMAMGVTGVREITVAVPVVGPPNAAPRTWE